MRRILYRADGSAEIGTGHLVRGFLLARACSGTEFTFVTRAHPWAVARIEEAGYAVRPVPVTIDPTAEVKAVCEVAESLPADLVVVDLLDTGGVPDLCAAMRSLGVPVLTLDNTGPGRLSAAEVINVLVREPDPNALTVRGVRLLEGPEYATLMPEYEGVSAVAKEIAPQAQQVLISVGGGDAAGLALKTVRALARLPSPLAATVVVGSAFPHMDSLRELTETARAPVTVRQALPSLLPEFQRADMAVVAGGLTMHEALATGTPALALCQAVRHQRFLAEWFEEREAMVCLGQGETTEEAQIVEAIERIAADATRRAAMSRAGQALVDGGGTRRVAERLMALARRD